MNASKPLPSNYELIAAKVEHCDALFDVYAFEDDDQLTLGAVCVHGTKTDLYDVLSDPALDHFSRLVDSYDPVAEERRERAMDAAAGVLLGCAVG